MTVVEFERWVLKWINPTDVPWDNNSWWDVPKEFRREIYKITGHNITME